MGHFKILLSRPRSKWANLLKNLYDFNKLSLEDMQKVVWEHGVFLDNYITEDIRINCYAIDKFFVEVVYDGKHNVITEVRSFKYGHELNNYSANFTIE